MSLRSSTPISLHSLLPVMVLAAVSISLFGCDLISSGVVSDPVSETPVETAWYRVYFSDPENPSSDSYKGGSDEDLAAAIDGASLSVDVAIYDLNLWSVRNAIVAAHDRGVEVRVVVESDNLDEPEIQDLIDASIHVLGDRREAYMHNKFVVIDNYEVWTGSMNFTTNDAYRNDNNLLCIRSTRVAENYTVEFEEMWLEDLFSTDSLNATPYPAVEIDGTRIEVLFSPDDGTAARLLELLDNAQESIYFLAYSFTSDDLSAVLIEQAASGVQVAGVMEESQVVSNMGGEFENMLTHGIDVQIDGNPRNMHHKVIIIDRQIVITGSYNFSGNAEDRNDENTLIIFNADIAALYLQEYSRIYRAAIAQ